MNSALETFVPLQFKRKKGKLLVDGREGGHDVRIIEAVARAMHWHALLDTGAFKSVVEIARAEGLILNPAVTPAHLHVQGANGVSGAARWPRGCA